MTQRHLVPHPPFSKEWRHRKKKTSPMFKVYDREGRELAFHGELLGWANSRRSDEQYRWSETLIYRTAGGRYIIAGIGKTLVRGEDERHWAHVCESAVGVVDGLYREDDAGIRFMTRVNREALRQAIQYDDELRQAFLREVVS